MLQSLPTTETITSPSNARVRSTMKLRDATARRQTGLTLIDGQREIQRCLTAKKEIVEITVTKTKNPSAKISTFFFSLDFILFNIRFFWILNY